MVRRIVVLGSLVVGLFVGSIGAPRPAQAQGIWVGGIGGPGFYGSGPYGSGLYGYGPGFLPYGFGNAAFFGGYVPMRYPVVVARPVVAAPVVAAPVVTPVYGPRPAVAVPLNRAYRRAWRRGW